MTATRLLCSACGFAQAWCICVRTYPAEPTAHLLPSERRAADGSVHRATCGLFSPDSFKASNGCDCRAIQASPTGEKNG